MKISTSGVAPWNSNGTSVFPMLPRPIHILRLATKALVEKVIFSGARVYFSFTLLVPDWILESYTPSSLRLCGWWWCFGRPCLWTIKGSSRASTALVGDRTGQRTDHTATRQKYTTAQPSQPQTCGKELPSLPYWRIAGKWEGCVGTIVAAWHTKLKGSSRASIASPRWCSR